MIGQTLHNRYTVTAQLGKGAMGVVYRANDSQTRQEVAIKVIASELAFNEAMLERFKREGEALRQLRHPNIVGFVDAFQHDDQYLLAMEYVSGGSLQNLIKRGPLSVERARQIALELSDALTRAHYLNIIHRDLKPENILLDTDGTPKLTDFGVARLVSETNRLTGTGTQIGTPYYMSPEAWEGKPLDAQTDIWALGVVLYEMLSGEVPFGGETLVAVMHKVLTAPLPDIKTKRPDVPDGLVAILGRMLTRNKAARYQSMRELGADLERGAPPPTVAPVPAVAPAPDDSLLARTLPPDKTALPAPKWLFGLVGIGAVVLALAAGGIIFGPQLLVRLNGATPGPTTQSPAVTSPVSSSTAASTTAPVVAGGPRPTCSPGETELFFDNFDDGNADSWTFSDEGGNSATDWPVEMQDGTYVLMGEGHRWATNGSLTWRNYALSVRVKRFKDSAADMHANLLLNDGNRRYMVDYFGGGVQKQIGDNFPFIGQVTFTVDDGWHTLKYSVVGGNLEVSLDGNLRGAFEDPEPLTAGQIGLENLTGRFYYDDVLVCQLPQEVAAQSTTVSSEAVQVALADPWGAVTVPADDSIVLGVAADLSGNCAGLGLDQRDAVLLAIDDAGLVDGFGVRTVVADTINPGGGAAAAQELAAQAPAAIVGVTCSASMADFLPVITSANIVLISPSASHNDFSQQGSDIFNRVVLKDADNPGGESLTNTGAPQYQIFANAFTAKYDRECCQQFAAEAYDAARILLKAIESVAVVDENGQLIIPRQALAQAVRGTENYLGLSGIISFDENGDRLPYP